MSPAAPITFTASSTTRKNLLIQRLMGTIFGFMTGVILLPLILLVVILLIRAWPSLTWEFLVDVPRSGMRAGGIWPALAGTLYIVVFSLLVSAPMGILAGVYLNEYARDNWFTRAVHLAVVNLAGVPSIVHALFGVGAFVLFAGLGKSILAASFTVAIMTLPVIIVSTKEALAAVPMAFRVACWNLGATRWQAIRTVVLPNSIGGILTGVILAVCRAAGETAPIMFTGAVFFKAVVPGTLFPYKPTEQCMALSYHLHTLATQVPDVPEPMLYATAVVLLGFVLVFNSIAIGLRVCLRHRKRW
ncbi:MAG: phosphate ABC transporter permease PstA [Kiritimatiellae bacterium]|nr:phosphate ABC transporter permease PstA [Kiritimatiellia bacterium]